MTPHAWLRTRARAACWIALIVTAVTTGCVHAPEPALEQVKEASKLTTDLLIQFTKASDAANRAVMSDRDDTSVAFAREAGQATEAVQKDAAALRPILVALRHPDDLQLLDEFDSRFTEYRALDRRILELAVENTNLKAQRLSFGPAQAEADAFSDALATIAPANQADSWRVKAIAATAVGAVRRIQVLEAPHIAEPDETVATRMEQDMSALDGTARSALKELGGLVRPAARPQLAAAAAALDRFIAVNAEIIGLSRRNTNVRSLSLSLGEKGMLTAACEHSLRALQDALAKRGTSATR